MKPFIVPIILWGYVLSVLFAQTFWGGIYDRLIVAFDLSLNQAWILPVGLNLLVAVVGLPQVVSFIAAWRRRQTMPTSRYVGSSLTIGVVALAIGAAIFGTGKMRQLFPQAGEATEIFAAGQIADGFYTNRAVGVGLKLPANWQVMSLNSMGRAQYEGAYTVSGGGGIL